MTNKTPEQKEIEEIKVSIVSIRKHLDDLKQEKLDSIQSRTDINNKLDNILNALTDNAFNSNSGYLSRLNKVEKTQLLHNVFFMVIGFVVTSGIVMTALVKWLTK